MTQQYLQLHSIIVNELGLKQKSGPRRKSGRGKKNGPAGLPGQALQSERPALTRRFTCRAAAAREAVRAACSGMIGGDGEDP
jgi:hypothetical protein